MVHLLRERAIYILKETTKLQKEMQSIYLLSYLLQHLTDVTLPFNSKQVTTVWPPSYVFLPNIIGYLPGFEPHTAVKATHTVTIA